MLQLLMKVKPSVWDKERYTCAQTARRLIPISFVTTYLPLISRALCWLVRQVQLQAT